MSQRWKWGILLAGLLLALGGWCVWLAEQEPEYQGRPLSYYVRLYPLPDGSGDVTERERAAAAIREIGTNAIPWLLQWIRYEEPAGLRRLRQLFSGRYTGIFFVSPGSLQADQAVLAFGVLGPAADPALAELSRLAKQPESDLIGTRAIWALGRTQSTNALPHLVDILQHGTEQRRQTAAAALREMGEAARLAVPLLVACLGDQNKSLAYNAAHTLGRLKFEPAIAVPALGAALQDPRSEIRIAAAWTLRDYGPDARSAVPVLLQALSDRHEVVQSHASNALWYIAPEVLTNSAAPR